MDSLNTNSLTSAQKEEMMDALKQQLLIARMQDLVNKITEKCFKKCISKPGTTLDGSDQKCLAMCMDRYMDSQSLVERTFRDRINREREKM